MTDLEKIIEKINYAFRQGFITQKETEDLRKLSRSLATQKGALGEKDRNQINQALNNALNKKGKQVKEETGLKPPNTGGKPGTGTTPGGGGKPGSGTAPGSGGEPGGDQKPGDSGGEKWSKFKKGYNSLKNDNDKKFIRNIFGGVPRDDRLANWQTLSNEKKNALVNSVSDGKITDNEKKSLKSLFKTPSGGGGTPGTGGGGEGGSGPGGGDDEEGDIDEGGGNNGGGGGEEYDDTPTHGGPNPTQKGGGKKINVPKNENRANYSIPKKSDERITMPNIDKKILKEVQRITKQLITSTKEFIEGGINYDGIDFIPDDEIYTEDGQSIFNFTDYNAPGTVNSGMADERMNDIEKAIRDLLNQGDKNIPKSYNYAEYIDLFELRYNNNGIPYYRFSLELQGEIVEDLVVTLINDEVGANK